MHFASFKHAMKLAVGFSSMGNDHNAAGKAVQSMADKGQECYIIHYTCQNLSGGKRIMELIEKEGVKLNENGLQSSQNYDGSYNFTVSLSII